MSEGGMYGEQRIVEAEGGLVLHLILNYEVPTHGDTEDRGQRRPAREVQAHR
jgi:hypothetical protein